jgi:hypothetical protein
VPLDFHLPASQPAAHQEVAAHDEQREPLVAASLAVLIVAAIAVLMGMA